MDKRQFILDTLLPYKNDPRTCGFNIYSKSCTYLDEGTGKMCAVGKHLIKGEHQDSGEDVYDLAAMYGVEDGEDEDGYITYNINNILTPEAAAVGLTIQEWAALQQYHDIIAMVFNKSTNKLGGDLAIDAINRNVELIEIRTGLKFPELLVEEYVTIDSF